MNSNPRERKNWLLSGYYLLAFGGMPIAALTAVVLLVPSLYVTIGYRGIFLGLSLWIFHAAYRERLLVRIGGWEAVALTFYFMYGLRIFYEVYINAGQPLRHPSHHYPIFLFGVLLLPSLAFLRPLRPHEVHTVFRTLGYGMSIVMIIATVYYKDFFLTESGRLRANEFTGDAFGLSPLLLGYMGSTTMVLGLFSLVDRRLLGKFSVIQGVFIIIAGMGPFFIGASRGPVMVMLICALLLAICKLRAGQQLRVLSFVTVFVILAVSAYFAADFFGSRVFERFIATGEQIETGSSGAVRLEIWKVTLNGIIQSPAWGRGLEPFGHLPHNAILEAYSATGILGGSLFVLLMGKSLICSLSLMRSGAGYGWIGLLFLHFFVMHMFSSAIWMGGPLLYTCVASISSSIYLRQMRKFPVRRELMQPIVPIQKSIVRRGC